LGGDKLKREIEFIENSINALPEADYKMMVAVYIDKISARKVARSLFISESGIRKRLEKTIKAIAAVYESVFQ